MSRRAGGNVDRLKKEIDRLLESELNKVPGAEPVVPAPSRGFQRVLQRAAIHVQSSGREEVTGANVLVAIFAERESPAAYFLQEQEMTRDDAVNYISDGIKKGDGDTAV